MPTDPFDRWHRVADLVRLVAISTRVSNISAPLNMILVGPPGDGKSQMVMRCQHLPHIRVVSDTTYTGLLRILRTVQDGLVSGIVVPDLGTLVGRRGETAKQTIATLAMAMAEGLRETSVGKRLHDFGGARLSLLTAITSKDLDMAQETLDQNGFLSRVLLVDFDLSFAELHAMLERKHRGDASLLRPLSFKKAMNKKDCPRRPILMAETYAKIARSWWVDLRRERDDRFFGFRSGDYLSGLLMASAYLRSADRVTREDVRFVESRVLPLVMKQTKIKTPGTSVA